MTELLIKSLRVFAAALIAAVSVSCATSVTFDVEHPPEVDLRGVNTITVIPFEKNNNNGDKHLSAYVTSAIITGIQNNIRGNVGFVDPQILTNVPEQNIWQYADVFIAGRITGTGSNIARGTNRNVNEEVFGMDTVTLTVTVDIEYAYVRAKDGRTLGTYRKSESFTETSRFIRRQDTGYRNGFEDRNRPGGRHSEWDTGRFDRHRSRRGQSYSDFPQRGSWMESIAKSAIDRFSFTMDRELASWTTTEKRNLRKRGKNPALDAARILAGMGRYDQAFRAYLEIYQQNGNIVAGYNAAVLLAADDKLTESLELLENVHRGLSVSEQKTPRFIRKEITKMAGFVNGWRTMEEYRASRIGAATDKNAANSLESLNLAAATEDEPDGEIRGTVNLGAATVYALRESISHADDASIWPKIVASTDTGINGRWSMKIPVAAPALLWFVVIDGRSSVYITPTAVGTSGMVTLNTSLMTRLE